MNIRHSNINKKVFAPILGLEELSNYGTLISIQRMA